VEGEELSKHTPNARGVKDELLPLPHEDIRFNWQQ
jgi:hypothetical protein